MIELREAILQRTHDERCNELASINSSCKYSDSSSHTFTFDQISRASLESTTDKSSRQTHQDDGHD